MAIREPRKHHYIPQWYLRQFGTRDCIGVFDKVTRTFTVEHPSDTAFEIGLYDIDHQGLPRWAFEKVLSNVENHAANAVRKLIDRGLASLTDDQREDVAAFIATQQVRVPGARPAIQREMQDRLGRIRSQLTPDEMRELAGTDLTDDQVDQLRGSTPLESLPAAVMAYGVSLALSQFVQQLLNDYRWELLTVAPEGLITSDTPVKSMTDTGADGTPSYFADVPLDQAHVLVLHSGPGGRIADAHGGTHMLMRDPDGTPSLQQFQLMNLLKADRLVFGHPDNPFLQGLADR